MRQKIFIVLFVIFLGNLFLRIYSYKKEYTTSYDTKYWESRYQKSQWNAQVGCGDFDPHINPKTCQWDDGWYQSTGRFKIVKKQESIGDDGLYAYAGWKYITGKDPTLLNAEMPPFGKYLIGLSILVFHNQAIFALISGVGVLFALFLLGKLLIKDNFLAFIPVVLFSFEPLFYTQLRAPYLDLLYLFCLLFTFYFFLKNNFLFSSIFFGLMIATKASIASCITVAVTIILYCILSKNISLLKKWVISTPVAVGVFLLSYGRYFFLGHGIIDFLKVQKWVFTFYSQGAKGDFLSAFKILLLGRWDTWFGTTSRVSEWSIVWTILFISFVGYFIWIVRQKKIESIFLLVLWVTVYIGFLTFVPVFPRYLLVIIPFLYMILIYFIQQITQKNNK